MSYTIRSVLDSPLWFRSALTLVLYGGCKPSDDGGTDAQSASAGSTDASETAGTDGTGGSSGETGSTDPTTGGAEGTGTTEVGPSVCGAVNGDYGDCGQELGYAFDGVDCSPRTGCDCAPDCDKFFTGRAGCANACAASGECNPERIQGAGAKSGDVAPGDFCDSLRFCDLDLDAASLLETFFFVQYAEVDPVNPALFAPCEKSLALVTLGAQGGELTQDLWSTLCALSLLPDIGTSWCYVE